MLSTGRRLAREECTNSQPELGDPGTTKIKLNSPMVWSFLRCPLPIISQLCIMTSTVIAIVHRVRRSTTWICNMIWVLWSWTKKWDDAVANTERKLLRISVHVVSGCLPGKLGTNKCCRRHFCFVYSRWSNLVVVYPLSSRPGLFAVVPSCVDGCCRLFYIPTIF